MLEKIKFLSFLCFNAALSLSLNAFNLEELNQDLPETPLKKVSIVDHGENLSFLPQAEDLLESRVEVSAKKLTKQELLESNFKNYDFDQIYKDMSDEDLMTITKTFFLYPNKNTDFFSLDRISSKEFCRVAFNDKKRKRVNDLTILSEKNIFTQKIKLKINFVEYNTKDKTLKGGSPEILDKLIEKAPLGTKNLDRIISTYSHASEISFGSSGSRVINYYYNIGDQHTLHSSIKIVSLKKEKLYSKLILRPLKIWKKVNNDALNEQKTGTRDSLQRIVKFIYS